MKQVLIDAGPLVALLDKGDRDHARCVRTVRRLLAELVTTWPVLTEAVYLLAEALQAQDALLGKVEDGSIRVATLEMEDVRKMRVLMRKYGDLPMDLADASLVCVADREGIRQVFTLDRRDFGVYRTAKGRPFTVMP